MLYTRTSRAGRSIDRIAGKSRKSSEILEIGKQSSVTRFNFVLNFNDVSNSLLFTTFYLNLFLDACASQ